MTEWICSVFRRLRTIRDGTILEWNWGCPHSHETSGQDSSLMDVVPPLFMAAWQQQVRGARWPSIAKTAGHRRREILCTPLRTSCSPVTVRVEHLHRKLGRVVSLWKANGAAWWAYTAGKVGPWSNTRLGEGQVGPRKLARSKFLSRVGPEALAGQVGPFILVSIFLFYLGSDLFW
jgi:hypothetical protein